MRSTRLLPDAGVAGADLPVRSALPETVAAVRDTGVAVLVAPPGSGKTSLLPLALADGLDGTVLVAEPRRLATRAAAYRLAALVGEQPGRRIGYAMRGERAGGRDVRVEVVTTGLLVQRMQREPDLPGVAAIVIDECHERHLDADLALAFGLDVRTNLRDDLALVATSATPDVQALTRALSVAGPVPVVTAETARYDVDIVWAPPPAPAALLPDARVDPRLLDHVAATVGRALAEGPGDVLVFVPGESEISAVVRRLPRGVDAHPLFGRQSRTEQERALTPGRSRRVVVTTSVAESSLTVPGVRSVVDSGLARRPFTDQGRGLSALITTRASKASADQRAGRAGREAPGRVYRCWAETDHHHLDEQTPPEIATADLTGFALSLAAWGAPGGTGLALLDRPPVVAFEAAVELLGRLGAITDTGRITERGRRMAAVGTHPRLARAVLDGAELVGRTRALETVALLSDGTLAVDDDLPARLRTLRGGRDRAATQRWRDEMRRLERQGPPESPVAAAALPDDLAVGTVIGLAYPDRLARLRRADSNSYHLANGTGGTLAPTSGLRGSEWLAVAVADRPVGRSDARILAAAPIDDRTARRIAGDLLSRDDEIRWDAPTSSLIIRRTEMLGAIVLAEAPLVNPDPLRVHEAVLDGLRRAGLDVLSWGDSAQQLRARLGFCHTYLGHPWPDVGDDALLAGLDAWLGPDLTRVRRARDLGRIDVTSALRRLLPWPSATRLDDLAPERLTVPSGRRVQIDYDGDAPPAVRVKVQEAFGWTTTPELADGRAPVVLHLLSPAGRTVAITADLASFWVQGYPQVRADLRARYPRHPWPEDPLTVPPRRVPAAGSRERRRP